MHYATLLQSFYLSNFTISSMFYNLDFDTLQQVTLYKMMLSRTNQLYSILGNF